eukprot:m.121255 g.121255  ORF g.121255 m.121255 type:complete len:110 (-) comp16199_c0_seq1:75-404(-)
MITSPPIHTQKKTPHFLFHNIQNPFHSHPLIHAALAASMVALTRAASAGWRRVMGMGAPCTGAGLREDGCCSPDAMARCTGQSGWQSGVERCSGEHLSAHEYVPVSQAG